ncbi:MAG: hypothetical protein ACK8QZ_02110 [Anaerolineales bacterium]
MSDFLSNVIAPWFGFPGVFVTVLLVLIGIWRRDWRWAAVSVITILPFTFYLVGASESSPFGCHFSPFAGHRRLADPKRKALVGALAPSTARDPHPWLALCAFDMEGIAPLGLSDLLEAL